MESSEQENLIKYLGGEMSFQDWLSTQQIPNESTRERILQSVEELDENMPVSDQQQSKQEDQLKQIGLRVDNELQLDDDTDEDSVDEIILRADDVEEEPSMMSQIYYIAMSYEHRADDEEEEPAMMRADRPIFLNHTSTTATRLSFGFQLPSDEKLGLNMDDTQLSDDQRQAKQMLPIIQGISEILSNSTPQEDKSIKELEEDEIKGGHLEAIRGLQDYKLRRHGRRAAGGSQTLQQTRLPEMLRLNMGQANIHVAKGEFKQAADICMDIIKEVPRSALPFKLMSFIYEEQGEELTALQYGLLAAHLQCHDASEWLDLAQRCLRAGDTRQQLTCYDKACKLSPTDLPLLWDRASLYLMNGDFRKAMDHYANILKVIKPSDVQQYMDRCKTVTEMYQHSNQPEKACDILANALAICSEQVDIDALNTYLDMLISSKEYKTTLDAICKFCQVRVPDYMSKRISDHTAITTNVESIQLDEESESSFKNLINSAIHGDFEFTSAITASLLPAASEIEKQLSEQGTGKLEKNSDDKQYTDLDGVSTSKLDVASTSNTCSISQYQVPESVPMDIRVKLVRVLILFQETSTELDRILLPLFSADVNSVGELYLTVGIAYMDVGKYEDALCCLQDLVVTPKFNDANIWLKIAECYDALGEIDRCVESYNMVLMFDPQHVHVRLSLAAILRLQGKNEEALQILKEYSEEKVESNKEVSTNQMPAVQISTSKLKDDEFELWHKKCMLLYTEHHLQDFIHNGYILLYNYLRSNFALQKKVVMGKAIMWELLVKFLTVASNMGEYDKCCSLVTSALDFRPFSESKTYRLDLDYYTTTTFLVAGDSSRAFDAFRFLLMHETDTVKRESVALWNLFAAIVSHMTDRRHHRFTLRFLFKMPHLVPLVIQNGINSHLSGTYKYAIGEFARAFKECPSDPLISLLMGVSFLHLSCQKFHTTRHTSILQGMIFTFQYFWLRGENQEACYNVGRAFHQIGLVHFAVHYYNKALSFPLHDEKDVGSLHDVQYNPHVDLHREAAYNLSLIYKASGNDELARKTLYRYCWV